MTLDHIGPCWAILDQFGTFWAILYHFRQYGTIMDHLVNCGPFKTNFVYFVQLLKKNWTILTTFSPPPKKMVGGRGGGSSYADTHLLSDRGDTCSTSATWSYRQHYLEEKDESISQSQGCFSTALATPGLVISVFEV